ncbi:hypothetical protein [Sporosarcina ureae]|uniref:hypothetical protein n=1 Tax=Sporosarcina ureae TaxID=1571 RepID=UPI000A17F5BB|nr:hypothetical protein [Sporosarcina ureae]ARK22240.1 hypothetical protein SporoP32a_12325 [Sporosarcina ureae]
MIEKVQLTLHVPQLQSRSKTPEPVIAGEPCFFHSLEQYCEKSIHDPSGRVSYLYGIARDEMIFEQVVIYYDANQIIFSYEKTNVDASKELLEQLKKENVEYHPMSKTFLVGPDE